MSTPNHVERDDLSFILGSSRRVALRDVEPGLADLWRLTGEEAVARGQPGVVRVRELNLVVMAVSPAMVGRVSNVVAHLSRHHPGRVVVLLDEGAAPGDDAPDAWVSAACYMNREGGRNICWEQVTIPARGAAAGHLGTMAIPYLVPDIPVCTWWPDDADVHGPVFRDLVEISDKLILDSAGFRDGLTGLAALASLSAGRERPLVLGDLTWGRLTAWREMAAGLFDSPLRRPLLHLVDRVRVVYGEEDAYRDAEGGLRRPATARALLFVAWLATRLGWTLRDHAWEAHEGTVRIHLRSELGLPVLVEFVAREYPQCAFGGVHELTLEAGSGRPEAVALSVSRAPETCVCAASVWEGGRQSVSRSVEVAPETDDQLLSQELDYAGVDEVYQESLLFAATLGALPGADLLEGPAADG